MCIVDCESYDYYCFCQDYHSCTTEHVTRDWFGEVREVDLADLKQEPDDVCCVLCPVSVYYSRNNLYRSLVRERLLILTQQLMNHICCGLQVTVILLQCSYCLFSVRIMSPVLRVLSKMKLMLMKNWVICGLLLYWRHSTWLGMLCIVN